MNKLNIGRYQEEAMEFGLVLRGRFMVEPDDDVPPLPDAHEARILLLFGNAGSSIWPVFSGSPEFKDGEPDPLDRWSARIGKKLAVEWGGMALFPFGGPPYQPFLRWAKKAENLESSALGMLLHPVYGLWHAYRFAIAIPLLPAQQINIEPGDKERNACHRCRDKPCLDNCPVNAFSDRGYDVEKCFNFLAANPQASCHRNGCQSRLACPEGFEYRYHPDHAAFHMEKFYHSLKPRFG